MLLKEIEGLGAMIKLHYIDIYCCGNEDQGQENGIFYPLFGIEENYIGIYI